MAGEDVLCPLDDFRKAYSMEKEYTYIFRILLLIPTIQAFFIKKHSKLPFLLQGA